MKVGIISLGCDKNRCNTETMLSYLIDGGFEITNEINIAEIIIVNTCAFLEAAREEAISTLLETAELKKTGCLKKLIATGCLPQKYVNEIFNDFVEVDAFLGTYDYPKICEVINRTMNGERVNAVKTNNEQEKIDRVLTTPYHYAYLRIADGCNNHCTYCTIPSIRGKYFSRAIEELILEATNLVNMGVRELILVAQDVTNYGSDLYGEYRLVELLQNLSKIEGLERIRLLYCYPERVTDELIQEMATNNKIVKYIDIPLQHASNSVLIRMAREGSYENYVNLINKLRYEIKKIAIRSTVMVGFPGETDEEFQDLIKFVKETKPLNCGVFIYSDEEDAASNKLKNKVPIEVAQKRYNKLLDVLSLISYNIKSEFIGKELEVVYDDIDYENGRFIGRSYISAPEIDSLVYFTSEKLVEIGKSYTVLITDIENDDLLGVVQ